MTTASSTALSPAASSATCASGSRAGRGTASSASDLVPLTVVANQAEAELVRNRLELEQIPSESRTTNFGAGSMDGLAGGQQEILVLAEDLGRARKLLG